MRRRRRGRSRAPLALLAAGGVLLLASAPTAWTAAVSVPTTAVRKLSSPHPTYSVTAVAGSHTRNVVLQFTGLDVLVTPLAGSAEAGAVRVRVRGSDGTTTDWLSCTRRSGRTWTCTHAPLTSTSEPTVVQHAALP